MFAANLSAEFHHGKRRTRLAVSVRDWLVGWENRELDPSRQQFQRGEVRTCAPTRELLKIRERAKQNRHACASGGRTKPQLHLSSPRTTTYVVVACSGQSSITIATLSVAHHPPERSTSSPSDGERLLFRLHRSVGCLRQYLTFRWDASVTYYNWLHRDRDYGHVAGSQAGSRGGPSSPRWGLRRQISPLFAETSTTRSVTIDSCYTAASPSRSRSATCTYVARTSFVPGAHHAIPLMVGAELPRAAAIHARGRHLT